MACDIKRTENDKKWGCCMILFDPNNPNKTLVCKRALGERMEPGSWGFIGGKVDIGETPAETIVREIKEEIGITVHQYNYIGSYEENEYIDYVFISKSWSGNITLDPEECSAYAWVTFSEINNHIINNEPASIFSFTLSTVKFFEKWINEYNRSL